MVQPGQIANAWDILDVPDHIAVDLIMLGRAVQADEPARIETREPVIESRDPIPQEETQPKRLYRRRTAT